MNIELIGQCPLYSIYLSTDHTSSGDKRNLMTESIHGYQLSHSSHIIRHHSGLFSTVYRSLVSYTIIVLYQGRGIYVPEQYQIAKHDWIIKERYQYRNLHLRGKCSIAEFSSQIDDTIHTESELTLIVLSSWRAPFTSVIIDRFIQ